MPVTLEQEVIEAILILRCLCFLIQFSKFFKQTKPSSLQGTTTTSAMVSNQEVWLE